MIFNRYMSALAIAAALVSGSAQAVTLQQAAKPREAPPSTYRGDVYVDSRGCAYARANVGSATNWVPRLSPNRKEVVCGLTPTFAAGSTRAPRVPAPIAPPPVSEVETAATTTTTAPAQPQTRPVATTSNTPAARTNNPFFANLPTPSPAPEPTVFPSTRVAAATTAATAPARQMNVTCPTTTGTARVRIGGSTVNVNCGNSAVQPATYTVRHPNGSTTQLVANPAPVVMAQAQNVATYGQYRPANRRPATVSSRIILNHPVYEVPSVTLDGTRATTAPRMTMHDANITSTYRVPHAGESYEAYIADKARAMAQSGIPFTYGAELQASPLPSPYAGRNYHRAPSAQVTTAPYSNPPAPVAAANATVVPEGYRQAWDDDRLNPRRAQRTIEGEQQMQAIWSNTVPRVLLNQ